MRKVFLDELPYTYKGINWSECVGKRVHFIYEDIEGDLDIIRCEGISIYIKYLDSDDYKIRKDIFSKCGIGNLLKVITMDFKVEIGETFKDENRDITIIDRKYIPKEVVFKDGRKSINNKKWYKYKCNTCEYAENWIREDHLMNGIGCSCCVGRTVFQGFNDIPTTAPWMVKYFQGGLEEAKLYTRNGGGNSNNRGGKIFPICPDCSRVRSQKVAIAKIYKRHSIGCSCSDDISYPEKMIFNVLEQLNLNFKTQLNKTTFSWCKDYRYDFYFSLNNKHIIVEAHGEQHYYETNRKGARTLQEEQENDRLKKKLALENGVKEDNYIVIDCAKSDLEYIKQNILKSKLNNLFDLSSIDWSKAEEFACCNLVKTACEYKRDNPNMTTAEIGNIMHLSSATICTYLKRGTKLWDWINYDAKKEFEKNYIHKKREVEIFKNGVSLGRFESLSELSRKSEKLFGIRLTHNSISLSCSKKVKHYKGFTFEYCDS